MSTEPEHHNNEAFQKQRAQEDTEHAAMKALLPAEIVSLLREDASMGLDLSPGDPLAKAAADLIESLSKERQTLIGFIQEVQEVAGVDITDGESELWREVASWLDRVQDYYQRRLVASDELQNLTRQFFEYLDRTEESDEGRVFHPVSFGCCRAAWTDDINRIMARMKELSK